MTKFNETANNIIEKVRSGTIYEKDQFYPVVKYSYRTNDKKPDGISTFIGIVTKVGDKEGFDTPKEADDAYEKFKKSVLKAKDGEIITMYMSKGGQVESMIKALSTSTKVQAIRNLDSREYK